MVTENVCRKLLKRHEYRLVLSTTTITRVWCGRTQCCQIKKKKYGYEIYFETLNKLFNAVELLRFITKILFETVFVIFRTV